MKKLLTVITIALTMNCIAQTDSSAIKVSLSLRANDIEFIAAILNGEEDFYDIAKAKFRVANPPNGVTLVTLDSTPVYEIMSIADKLRSNVIACSNNIWSRYNTVIRALGQSYIVTQLNEAEIALTNGLQEMRRLGRKKLTRL